MDNSCCSCVWSDVKTKIDVILEVGRSDSVSKTVQLTENAAVCPGVVDKGNWLGGEKCGDTFAVSQSGSSVTVTRTDSNSGWAMNLRITCAVVPTCPSTKLTTYCSAVSTQEECEQSYTEESPTYPQKCSWIDLNCLSGDGCELPKEDQFEWVQQPHTQCGSTAAENTAAEAAIGRANMSSPGRTDNSHLKPYGGTSIPLAQCQEECLANPMCRGIEVSDNEVEADHASPCCFMYSGTGAGSWTGSCWYIKKNGKVWKYE